MSKQNKRFLFPTEEEIIINKAEPQENIVPIEQPRVELKVPVEEKSKNTETGIFKPLAFEDARGIANSMINGLSVIVNIHDVLMVENGGQIASRIIDYLCGVAYAISFEVRRINNTTFLFTSNPVKEIKI